MNDEIIRQAQHEATDLSVDDLENMLSDASATCSYLKDMTTDDIMQDVRDAVYESEIDNPEEIIQRLIGYRYVDEIHEVDRGKYTTYIKYTNNGPRKAGGGFATRLKFTDRGVNVVCKTPQRKCYEYCFNDCVTFQKLTDQEQLVLMANECLRNETSS